MSPAVFARLADRRRTTRRQVAESCNGRVFWPMRYSVPRMRVAERDYYSALQLVRKGF